MKIITCSAAQRLLNLAVDQRLSPKRAAALEHHLDQCDACRQERAYLETLRAALADAKCAETPAPEPAELTRLIMARIADYEAPRATKTAKTATAIDASAPQPAAPALKMRAPVRTPASVSTRSPGLMRWAATPLHMRLHMRRGVVVNAWASWKTWRTSEVNHPSWRWSAVALLLLALAAGLWAFAWPAPLPFSAGQLTPTHLLTDGATLFTGLMQWLFTPGPESIAWIVWVSGALVALTLMVWVARSDGSAAWRRALADRLPQLW